MNILRNKILLTALVIFCCNLQKISAQNATSILKIPIIATHVIGPRKFERIIVPVYDSLPRPKDEDDEKPVTEKIVDVESTTQELKMLSKSPKNIDDGKGNYQKSYSYVTRSDGYGKRLTPKNSPKPHEGNSIKQQQTGYGIKHEVPPKEAPEHRSLSKPAENSKASESSDSKQKETTKPKVYDKPHEIQPLHVKTHIFEQSKPNHKEPTPEEKKKKFQNQEERLKIKNLPENPQKVPKTDWFDNHGKYNYGIVHDEHIPEENASLEDADDTTEDESHESPKETHVVIQHPPSEVSHPAPIPHPVPHPAPPTQKFKSNFNDPNLFGSVHQQNNGDGKFLYKSEVFYPTYRDHLYLPFTTYYGDANIFPKQVFNAHTVYHTPQTVQHIDLNHPNKAPETPIKVPIAVPQEQPKVKSTKPLPPPPRKTHPPVVHRQEHHPPKHPQMPAKKPVEKQAPPPKHHDDEEEDDDESADDEDNGNKAEVYDYEEGDSFEDDEGTNDKYRGESSEDADEEEEELPKYAYSSFRARNDEKSEEDEFDRAWRKYGYAPTDESDENESSESRLVTQKIEPERKKIVHMKMEYFTQPYDGSDIIGLPSNNKEVEVVKPQREMNSKMSGTINNNNEKDESKKRKKKNKKPSVKSQQQHPNAGPDDLKFFQYFNYLGNGDHRAGGRVGNDKHYVEQHERGSKVAGAFQKKVKWADKDGGFGEHYWDLNHGK